MARDLAVWLCPPFQGPGNGPYVSGLCGRVRDDHVIFEAVG